MSRCFPFPPPGYGARGDALIESIKLREEMEKAKKEKWEKKEKREKKDKKEKKREKKERKKEKKDRKHRERTTSISHGSDEVKKFKVVDEIKETKADGKLQKGGDCDNEQLERSGITEELDQPVTSVEPCCLSDSTQSSKRKRSSPQTGHDHGPPIKIRLPLRKHVEPEESNSKSKFEVVAGGSVGIANSFTKATVNCVVVTKNTVGGDCQSQQLNKVEAKQVLGFPDAIHGKALEGSFHGDSVVNKSSRGSDRKSHSLKNSEPRHGKSTQNSFHGDAVVTKNPHVSDRQLQCPIKTQSKRIVGNSDSKHCKPLQKDLVLADDTVMTNKAVDDESQKALSYYNSLLQIPPLMNDDGLDSLYEDWLFSSELKEAKPVSKKQKTDSATFQFSTSTSSMWPPRAQYLPEVQLHALPYVVPF